MSSNFKDLRLFIYNYHLNGLDLLQGNQTAAVKKIIGFLTDLQQLDKQKLGAIFPNIFFAAKSEEIVNVLSLSDMQEKIKIYNVMSTVDPANSSKYEELKINK
ncbi:hypothetical protein D9M68_692870 [compost metagenome]